MGDELYDAPNQQAVGQPPPWVEGTGGSAGDAEGPEPQEAEPQEAEAKPEAKAKKDKKDG